MKLYRLVDRYEGYFEFIYESNSLKKCKEYANYYDNEVVGGECYITLYKYDGQCYRIVKDWMY